MHARTEGEWLVALDPQTKLVFLARLAHGLTVAGRSTYLAGSEGVERPADLRKINEILHRITACQRDLLLGTASVEFQKSIAAWVLDHSEPDFAHLLSWTWSRSKETIQH